jgi:hypothetical protein
MAIAPPVSFLSTINKIQYYTTVNTETAAIYSCDTLTPRNVKVLTAPAS